MLLIQIKDKKLQLTKDLYIVNNEIIDIDKNYEKLKNKAKKTKRFNISKIKN